MKITRKPATFANSCIKTSGGRGINLLNGSLFVTAQQRVSSLTKTSSFHAASSTIIVASHFRELGFAVEPLKPKTLDLIRELNIRVRFEIKNTHFNQDLWVNIDVKL